MVPNEKSRQGPLQFAALWLERSIDSSTGGSRANYSLVYNGLKGWSAPYPETTGYIIPSFLKLANTSPQWAHLRDRAIRMGEWLLSIQFPDGAFPGNIYTPGKTQMRSVFNTGQIILGLSSLFDETKQVRFLSSSFKAAQWLAITQEPNGTWDKFNYVDGFSPSYYTRVAWPMLKVHRQSPNTEIESAAQKALLEIQSRQMPNGFIEGSGFKPAGYAFLHTLDYTIRGFLECALISGNEDWWNCGFRAADVLRRKFELSGKLCFIKKRG